VVALRRERFEFIGLEEKKVSEILSVAKALVLKVDV